MTTGNKDSGVELLFFATLSYTEGYRHAQFAARGKNVLSNVGSDMFTMPVPEPAFCLRSTLCLVYLSIL
jgi:hypothetical protein